MKILKSTFLFMFMAAGLMLAVNSCEKDPEPMELPPAESMVIDWDMFPTNSTKSADEALTVYNWFYSAGTIFVWNTVVAANIAVPTVAYAAAFNNEPVYQGDETWLWSYSVTVNQRTIDAELLGSRIDNETFSMEMTLSEAGGFEAFTWFKGEIRYDHTAANWTLSYSPQNPTPYLDVTYSKDFEDDVASIRYTVIDPQNELYEDYIEFGIDSSLEYDAHYTISRADTTTFIEWNTQTNAGHVMDQRQFGDEEWHCWDSQLQDVDCSVE